MTVAKKLWTGLILLLVVGFGVLLYVGSEIHRQAPPMPDAVVTDSGETIFTRADIEKGRQVWQSIGGQQLGSIWGHGALVAPDWTADWLHKEAMAMLEVAAQDKHSKPYEALNEGDKASLKAMLQAEIRQNSYNTDSKEIVITATRAKAMETVGAYYDSLFSADPESRHLRETYAMREDTIPDAEHRRVITAFFWWASWATVTQRPDSNISYTQNWPYDPVVGNTPTSSTFMWSVFSILFMVAGIALLSWHYAVWHSQEEAVTPPATDPMRNLHITPSMHATAKYFWLVLTLFLVQILLGALTAHYQVEGQEAYGFAISDWLPYSLTRTWHTQLAVLWIATAWLATGMYIGPAVSGYEPPLQKLGVNVLFVCLLVIVVGAFTGQWFAVMQKLGLDNNFWFGHQGWEYTDLGRFWQWFLFLGLLIWLTLVGRSLWPALRRKDETSSIVGLLFLSTVAIGLLYGAGLMWNEHTHISMVEYWRWWVVHLWVEGFFEVFAAAVVSFLFVKLGLVRGYTATINVLFATIIFMAGGILGTFHHEYFSGTTTSVLALGASFSALEVVPLALIGLEAYHTWQQSHATSWMQRYRWPIMFFLAVSFWNLVGAGLFGFLINTPLALYFMQGLNLTPLHGHTALFGVYGMLGIGLLLFCVRGLKPDVEWNSGTLAAGFWLLNLGLTLMALFTLLPMGILQLQAALENGYWYARSAEFMSGEIFDLLIWLRVIGDTIFAIGAITIAVFVARLWISPKISAVDSAANAS